MALGRDSTFHLAVAPLTVRFREGEPARALLRRLAVRRGSPDVAHFLSTIPNYPTKRLSRKVASEAELDAVAALAGFTPSALRRSTPLLGEGGYEIDGVWIGTSSLARGPNLTGRICPQCLGEDKASHDGPLDCRPYRRFWWDIEGIDLCPEHETPLLTTCPECAAPSHNVTIRPDVCLCGADRTSVPAEMVTGGFDAELLGMMRGSGRADWAHGLSIQSVGGLALRVGILAAGGAGVGVVRAMSPGTRSVLRNEGAAVLAGGRDALWHVFDKRARIPRARTLRSIYGDLYLWLERQGDRDLADYRALMAEHAEDALASVGSAGMGFSASKSNVSCPFFSSSGASSAENAFRLALDHHRDHHRHDRTEDMTCLLGISPARFHAVVRQGAGGRLDGATPHLHATYRHDTASLYAFLRGLEDLYTHVQVPAGLVQLTKVRRMRRNWVEVYKAVREGVVPVVGLLASRHGVEALLVPRAGVATAFPIDRAEWGEPWLPAIEVQTRLGLDAREYASLRSARLISFVKRRTNDDRSCDAPSVASVVEFESAYLSMGALVRLSGRRKATLRATLRQMGQRPCEFEEAAVDFLVERPIGLALLERLANPVQP